MSSEFTDDLELLGVFDRGVPYQERIVFKCKKALNLGDFGLVLGSFTGHDEARGNTALPYRDTFYWFGNVEVDENTYIYLLTCDGNPRFTVTTVTKDPALVIHWGKEQTILNNESIVPILFRFSDIIIGRAQETLPSVPQK